MKKNMIIFTSILLSLMLILPVSAGIEQFILQRSSWKLAVNSTEINTANLPMLNYNGYNYIPVASLKDISQKIGVDFKVDNDTKSIDLTVKTNIQSAETITSSTNNNTEDDFEKMRNLDKPKISEIILEDGRKATLKFFYYFKTDIKDVAKIGFINCIYIDSEAYLETRIFSRFFKVYDDRYEYDIPNYNKVIKYKNQQNSNFIVYDKKNYVKVSDFGMTVEEVDKTLYLK